MEYLWAWGILIHEKNLSSKITCQTPFKYLVWSHDVPAGKPAGTVGTPPHILKINAERSRIWIWIQSRIRIHYSEVRIRGSGSAPKSHGSPTLLGTKTLTSCTNCYQIPYIFLYAKWAEFQRNSHSFRRISYNFLGKNCIPYKWQKPHSCCTLRVRCQINSFCFLQWHSYPTPLRVWNKLTKHA